MKKYELLLITKTIRKLRDISEIIIFLNELIDKLDDVQLYKTYEFTLFVYNIVLNTHYDVTYFFRKTLHKEVKNSVIQIMRQIYKNEFTPQDIEKFTNDIHFIQTHKEYTYISDIIWVGYLFFF